jgi:hypothetical protein
MRRTDTAGGRGFAVPTAVAPTGEAGSGEARRADIRAQAVHVLRTSGIVRYDGRLTALGEWESERVVAALSAAGLLRDPPAVPAEGDGALTAERAQAIYDQRRNELTFRTTIAASGAVRLVRCSAAQAFVTSSHREELYRGPDLGAAVAAYNAAVAGSAA